jgi:hypothetical protein
MTTQATPQGVTPSQILARHPPPWEYVTYTDGTIRVFNALKGEVGLLDVLALSIGVASGIAKARETAAGA